MKRLWKRVWKSKSVVLGGAIVLLVILAALSAPWLSGHDPYTMDVSRRLLPPGGEHLMGTDQFGRDLYARILFGARVSLEVGIISVGLAMSLGVTAGVVAGYYGGIVDTVIMRIVDMFLAFPVILLAIGIMAALGPKITNVMIALGLVYWTNYARIVRSTVLAVKEEEFVSAAKATGCSDLRIIVKHILPNTIAPVIVVATLGLGTAIVAEATLSFLGLGIQPPEPSWGWTLAFGMRFLRDAPHLSTFPGLAIMVTVLGFNLLGDGLRDLTDPRLKNR